MLRYSIISLLLCICAVSSVTAYEHPGGVHSKELLASVREHIAAGHQPWKAAYADLLTKANQGLAITPQPQDTFFVPGYYVVPDEHKAASAVINTDAQAAYACALVYQLSPSADRDKYAAKAKEIILAWARGNRHIGLDDSPLVMAYNGNALIFAAELIYNYSWTAAERDDLRQWLTGVAVPIEEHIKKTVVQNWSDWAVQFTISAAYLLDDEEAVYRDMEFIRYKIDSTIADDGHMPHETKREKNGLWYQYFALDALTTACQVAYNAHGAGFYGYENAQGGSIKKALDFLYYYCVHPDEWPYWTSINTGTTGGWPGDLIEGMSGIYGVSDWSAWVANARPVRELGHHHAAWTFATLMRPSAVNPVSFVFTPRLVPAPGAVKFTNTSLGSYTSWLWDFGDGKTSTRETTGHYYSDKGTYTVTLIGTNAQGSDTLVWPDAVRMVNRVTVEAESMALDGYVTETFSSTGRTSIKVDPAVTPPYAGTARSLFTGPSGIYNLTLETVPENDGASPITVYIGSRSNPVLQDTIPKDGLYYHPSEDLYVFTVTGITVHQGDSVIIEGTSVEAMIDTVVAASYARVDRLHFDEQSLLAGIRTGPTRQVAEMAVACGPHPMTDRFIFALPGRASVTIVDQTGRFIVCLTGTGPVVWDGKDATGNPVDPGVYFYAAGRQTGRIVKVR